MASCKICGSKPDLFPFCTNEEVCAICKIKFIGRLPATQERINQARIRLGLKNGELLQQDNGISCILTWLLLWQEARKILGR